MEYPLPSNNIIWYNASLRGGSFKAKLSAPTPRPIPEPDRAASYSPLSTLLRTTSAQEIPEGFTASHAAKTCMLNAKKELTKWNNPLYKKCETSESSLI